MFPEITRDEVFRLETQHLWLRWPMRSDGIDLAILLALGGAAAATKPGVARCTIDQWRADNEAGRALHMMIVPKTGLHEVIGLIRIVPGIGARPELVATIHPAWSGEGLLLEATTTLVTAAFLFGGLSTLVSQPGFGEIDARLALRSLGFAAQPRGGAEGRPRDTPLETFMLDRSTWGQGRAPAAAL